MYCVRSALPVNLAVAWLTCSFCAVKFRSLSTHYLLVTSVPNLHGGFCLYNGGFTAALICMIMVPELERFSRTKFERQAKRLEKAAK